jgi:Radical SAM superfamily/Iron-sulfur cluster-binding domain
MKSSLKDNFCSSPWFHLKITPAGDYISCRWDSSLTTSQHNISNTTLTEYMNSKVMCDLRQDLLNGGDPQICKSCRYEDHHDKVSGRQRQLLKSAINLKEFDKTFCASPHWEYFNYSYNNQGLTKTTPVDLQIDLGNTCNSACIMCIPSYSSRLATDYTFLNKIDQVLFPKYNVAKNWADNEELVEKFVKEISDISNIRYIHFLGGETLYLKSFYTICNKLIANGIAKNVSIGTTTNCTVYTPELENIIKEFKHVHLGLSVETFDTLNDYIRWPSQISSIVSNIEKFIELRKLTGLHLSLRITPTIFSIYHLDTIFEFMIKHSIIAESCNILQEPTCLRIELLPKELINRSIDKVNNIIEKYHLINNDQTIINRRRDDLVDPVIANVIFEYKHLLESMSPPSNIEQERFNLVKFIKAFESIRNNTILDHLPEYEKFLRSYGY